MDSVPSGSTPPPLAALRGLDAESINRVLEVLVAPLQSAMLQPTEVVLHDLRRFPDTVRAAAGTVAGRPVGDPLTDELLELIAAGALHHNVGYHSHLPDGRILQCTTIVYTDGDNHPAAALCLSTDVSAWVSLRSVMDRFVPGGDAAPPPAAKPFPLGVEELCALLVDAAIAATGVPVGKMRKEQKIQVVAELERRGFFLVKQAAELAAAALRVSRYTIYNYLNELNDTAGESA